MYIYVCMYVHMCACSCIYANMLMTMTAFRSSADTRGVSMLHLRPQNRIKCSCNIACRAVLIPAVQHGLTSPAYS